MVYLYQSNLLVSQSQEKRKRKERKSLIQKPKTQFKGWLLSLPHPQNAKRQRTPDPQKIPNPLNGHASAAPPPPHPAPRRRRHRRRRPGGRRVAERGGERPAPQVRPAQGAHPGRRLLHLRRGHGRLRDPPRQHLLRPLRLPPRLLREDHHGEALQGRHLRPLGRPGQEALPLGLRHGDGRAPRQGHHRVPGRLHLRVAVRVHVRRGTHLRDQRRRAAARRGGGDRGARPAPRCAGLNLELRIRFQQTPGPSSSPSPEPQSAGTRRLSCGLSCLYRYLVVAPVSTDM